MSDGSKRFGWGRKEGPVRCSRNWEKVMTRDRGDIPGCKPAFDVWVDVPLDVMQRETAKRAAEFCRLLETVGGTQEFKNHPFHSTDVKLSPITNPSAKVRQAWDYDFQG